MDWSRCFYPKLEFRKRIMSLIWSKNESSHEFLSAIKLVNGAANSDQSIFRTDWTNMKLSAPHSFTFCPYARPFVHSLVCLFVCSFFRSAFDLAYKRLVLILPACEWSNASRVKMNKTRTTSVEEENEKTNT